MKKNGETTLADVVESVNSLRTAMEAGFSTLTHAVIEVKTEVTELKTEVTELKTEVNGIKKSVDRLTDRFDRSLLTAGKRGVDHERRITRLEHQVAKLKATG